uniref:Nuclear VCP like n=1 Tax=Neolamprologus brichardi TaxID=32507 RepID=A0A3Q4HMC4_NEOBR
MDYGRRNKTAFRIQVEKGKRDAAARCDSKDELFHCSSWLVKDDHVKLHIEFLFNEKQPTNQMNSSLSSLYRRGSAATSSPRSTATPPPSASATLVSKGGWFIDRAPEKSGTIIDLCDDDPTKQPADVSMLEGERSHKKSKKRRKTADRSPETTETHTLNKKGTALFVSGIIQLLQCLLCIRWSDCKERHPQEMQLPMLKVSAPELVSGVSGESEQKLRELFDLAVSSAPCILFIDEIDAITPKREVASKDMERRIVAQLLTCMDDVNSLAVPAQLLVIGATNRPDSLDPALRRAGRFDREICMGIPDEAARLRILRTLCRKLTLPEDFDYQQLARLTPGYVGADLMALCREAAMSAVNRVLLETRGPPHSQSQTSAKEPSAGGAPTSTDVTSEQQQAADANPQGELWSVLCLLKSTETLSEEKLAGLSILMSDFQLSLASVQPSAKREGFATVPDVTWEDVGALQDVREELTMAILAPVRSPEQFRALGLSAPSGVLLAGPPGCGKTLLAKAVANESGLNFISVKGPELLNMYVGESERAVRQVFQRGRNSAPCVIFFDEIDALCPRRSGHESGASVRVVNQLLTEMDGLESRRQVFIMAATNRPDIIDPAVLRPGRLDKTLYVGLPPPADRRTILHTITKGGTRPQLEQDVSLEEIALDQRCDGFSGADLTALVREASLNALRTYLKSQPSSAASPGRTHSSGSAADIRVSKHNFEDAFGKVRPSVSTKDQRIYEQLRESLR